MILFTIMAGQRRPSFENWLEMAERYRYDVEVVGSEHEHFERFYTKWRCMLDFVSGVPAETLVFYLDASDAFVCEYPESVVSRYREYGRPVVVGAEHGPYPTHDYEVPASFQGEFWRWGNTGMMIGPAGGLREALEDGYELQNWEQFGHVSDQHAINLYFGLAHNRHKATVDCHRILVANYHAGTDDEVLHQMHVDKLRGHGTGREPACLHFFGSTSYASYDEFARLYDLRPCEES